MVALIFSSVFILFWCNTFTNVWAASLEGEDCISCSQRKAILSPENLRQLRVEFAKRQILSKLKMREPPKMNLPKPYFKPLIPSEELSENETDDEIDYSTQRESVVIYPEDENISCIGNEPDPCSRFDFILTKDLFMPNLQAAEIWLFTRNLEESVKVNQVVIDSSGNVDRMIELEHEADQNDDPWIRFNLPVHRLKSNVTKDHIFVFQVSYSVDEFNESPIGTSGDEKPFLIMHGMKYGGSPRSRRSTICEEGTSTCCRENFYLNFSEIGWDNWILHPDGYDANFCRGRCLHDLSTTRFYHSAVLLSYINDNKDIAEEIGLTVCCTPSSMSPISIIYRDEKGVIFRRSLENMRVDSCECA